MVAQFNKNQQQRLLIQQNRAEQDLTPTYYFLQPTFIKQEKCIWIQNVTDVSRESVSELAIQFVDTVLKFNRYFFKDTDNLG
jgi:hypothetical protein